MHHDTCHPRSTKLAVQKGVALRLKRICSTEEEFTKKSKEYQAYFISRGHDPEDINVNFEKVKTISRSIARKRQNKEKSEKKHRFFTEYNPACPNIAEIIKKHEHFLRNHEFLNKLFPPGSFQVVHRRCKNLRELMSRSDPYSIRSVDTNYSYLKCEVCDSCKNFVGGSSVTLFATGRVFQIRKYMNCNTP